MEDHDEIMQQIISCKTPEQLKEVEDCIRFNRHLSLGVKHFYFQKIKSHQTMLPLMLNMEKHGVVFTPKRLI